MDLATGAIGSILSKLADLLKAEYDLQSSVKQQLESLTRELHSAQAFLQQIDTIPPEQLDKQLKNWACEVRDASYDMEDILDNFLLCADDLKPIKKRKFEWLKEKMGSLFSKTKARHDIAGAIEEVNKKVKEIAERRSRYKLDHRVASPATPSSYYDPRIARVHGTKASLLVGIDERKDAVIKMLSREDDDMYVKKANIVSLVGFGGVGKTTLAKATYDQLIQNFECGAFVSVGRNPDLVKVFKDILFDLHKDNFKEIHSTQRGADLLIRELLDFLGDKRYLIVIDDIWEAQSRKRITEALTDNNIGSRIIITTRNSEVADGKVYKVQPLSDDNSKLLFYTRIFGGEDKCPKNQREKASEVTHKILKKCGGVPLAIITMASLLLGKTMDEWFEVCNSIGFRDKDNVQIDDTMWILSLSYYDLPSHLRTCLLYLSVFPEDYLIKKDTLIWMWIAEGFVNRKPGARLFEIGEIYFNELVNRSLIQPVEEKESRFIKRCRVHDMILDFIRSLSSETNFVVISDNGKDTLLGKKAHRLSLQNREVEGSPHRLALQNRVVEDSPHDNNMDKSQARSLVAFRYSFQSLVSLLSFKLLRVLYLDGCHLINFDEHIGAFLHLRCLVIRNTYFSEFPKQIGALKFLQVLYLGDEINGLLPLSMGMLTQLVCLRALGMSLPNGIIKDLASLQDLQICRGDDMGQFVKDLGNLSDLRVLKTSVQRMDERTQSELLKSLGNLHKMQHLELLHGVISGDKAALNGGLPSCIDTLHLPNLFQLSLNVDSLDDQGLKILGGLPQLSYLELSTWGGRATVTGTAAHGYFQKLRSCLLPDSMVHFVVKEDLSASFTIWHRSYDGPAFGSKNKQDICGVAHAIMPNLESLYFEVVVRILTECNNGSCDNLGLECLTSLQKVRVDFDRRFVLVDVVEKEEGALRHAIQVHPNQPTLEIEFFGEPEANSQRRTGG
ncbi:hypothetical protein BS78_05G256000 [Paspalum vaginatum]|nr:hypothetical protein BS78_05G256000 [Paspalum vaginatum]